MCMRQPQPYNWCDQSKFKNWRSNTLSRWQARLLSVCMRTQTRAHSRVYVLIHARMYVRVYACKHKHARTHTCSYMRSLKYKHKRALDACMHACVFQHAHAYMRTHVRIYAHACMYTHTHACVSLCMVHACTRLSLFGRRMHVRVIFFTCVCVVATVVRRWALQKPPTDPANPTLKKKELCMPLALPRREERLCFVQGKATPPTPCKSRR